MANARYLMNARIAGQVGQPRTIELTRPRSKPWQLELPAALDQVPVTAALVDFVTAQFLVDVPAAGIKLGWETIYALVRTALMETDEPATEWAAGLALTTDIELENRFSLNQAFPYGSSYSSSPLARQPAPL